MTMPLQDPTAIGARPNDSTATAGRAALGGILLLAAICLGLATLEAAARVVLDRNGMHYGIEMWKYAKEIKRRSANPLMSHEHAPNRQARLMGVDVTTGAQGLRDRDYPLEKRAGEYRILALGDSLTFGWGVPVERTYPKILEQMLNRERKAAAQTTR